MSYDVDLCDADEQTVFSINHTSNTKALWEDRGLILGEWDGTKAAEMLPRVLSTITRMMNERPSHQGNGWGTVESTLWFLTEILRACYANPDSIVRVSA